MFKKISSITLVVLFGVVLTACASDKSVKVASLQKRDKNLSCSEVMLEINEAEFYRNTAEKNKNPKIKSLLMPLGYISTYVNAEDAIGAAQARIDYLNRIYEILDCDNQKSRASARNPYSDYNINRGGGYGYNTGYAPQQLVHEPARYRQKAAGYW